jgi:hypothetical protein
VLLAIVCWTHLLAADAKGQPGPTKPASTSSAPEKRKSPSTEATSDKANSASLDEMLTDALKNNPDIQVAEAKVRESEAQLNRVRLQVTQKLITLRSSIESQKAAVEQARAAHERMNKMKGAVSVEDIGQAGTVLLDQEAKLAALDAELQSLLGRSPRARTGPAAGGPGIGVSRTNSLISAVAFSPDGRVVSAQGVDGKVRLWDAQTGKQITAEFETESRKATSGPIADRIRQALDKPISLKAQNKGLHDIVAMLRQAAPGIPFQVAVTENIAAPTEIVFDSMALGAILQAVEDSFQAVAGDSLRMYVRDYGILVTTVAMAPAGAVSVHEFWKGGRSGGGSSDPTKTGKGTVAVPAGTEGTVTRIGPEAGLLTITLGTDAGVQKGVTLEVYRLKPEPKYLGKVEVIEVHPDNSVAKPVGRSSSPIEVGDRVTTSVHGR